MALVSGVNMIPGTGEFTYSPIAYNGQRVTEPFASGINYYSQGTLPAFTEHEGDITLSIGQLQAAHPECTTIAVVAAWFFNSVTAANCQIYPSTTYQNNGSVYNTISGNYATISNSFWQNNGGHTGIPDHWRVSGLTEQTVKLKSISQVGSGSSATFVYGGTPSDQSIVECIRYIKTLMCPSTGQRMKVVFYPFLLGDVPGSNPWRGRITLDPTGSTPDRTASASSIVNNFLGSASSANPVVLTDFSQDSTNMTVNFQGGGNVTNCTFRRMILHYANLVCIAGGVDLFLIGSEMSGMETIRGGSWTEAGTTSGGVTTWDYPFVTGLIQIAADVKSIFATAGSAVSSTTNYVAYSPDWSSWMGVQHKLSNPSSYGQWPHLDQLFSNSNIDFVSFDNYLPLSDWTTGETPDKNLDMQNWSGAVPASWSNPANSPPSNPKTVGLGLSGPPQLFSLAYLKANIEGGEKFNWFYADGNNDGRGFDPNGTGLQISLPEGDRLAQNRQTYSSGLQITANKMLRWWWNNPHYALYPTGGAQTGSWAEQGKTGWAPKSKSVIFAEYGFPSCDKCTNQPNLFYTANSLESGTPYWSIWQNAGSTYRPLPDQNLFLLALQAVYEYWFTDNGGANNPVVSGVPMIEQAFCSAWCWDARPFPYFPQLNQVWGDAGNWQAGNWIEGKVSTPLNIIAPPPAPGTWPAFPTLRGRGWSTTYTPVFSTMTFQHVSGRESRASRMTTPLFDIEMTFDILDQATSQDFQTLAGFYEMCRGQNSPFIFQMPPGLSSMLTQYGLSSTLICRFADDDLDFEEFTRLLWSMKGLHIRSVRGE